MRRAGPAKFLRLSHRVSHLIKIWLNFDTPDSPISDLRWSEKTELVVCFGVTRFERVEHTRGLYCVKVSRNESGRC
jgi:hypothetical protein